MQRRLPIVAALAGLLGACSPDPAAPPEVLHIHLDERPILLGRVIEAIESPRSAELYLRLELLGGERRWVVLDQPSTQAPIGQWMIVRSLAKRSDVWVAAIEHDFAVLEYVALIPGPESSNERAHPQ